MTEDYLVHNIIFNSALLENILSDFLSFHDLWSWNRDGTRKREHLFPVWCFFEWLLIVPPPHHSKGSSTEWWELKYPAGGHCQWFTSSGGPSQWRRQRHLTWSATHDVVSREINPWKSFYLLKGSNPWPLAQSAKPVDHRCHFPRSIIDILRFCFSILMVFAYVILKQNSLVILINT